MVMVVLVLVAVVLGEVMKAGGACRAGGYGILLANVCVCKSVSVCVCVCVYLCL